MTTHVRTERAPLLALIGAALLFVVFALVYDKGQRAVISSDAEGYHAYLPAIFIRHDLGHEPYDSDYVHETPTGTLNKYTCGEALLLAPFFLIGHGLAQAFDLGPYPDAWTYGASTRVAAWSCSLLGLWFLNLLLRGLYVRPGPRAWVVASLAGGTQLLQYTSMHPGWSHAYSFFAVAAFLLSVQRLQRRYTVGRVVLTGACLGLIILLRPSNALVALALPIVLGKDTWSFVKMLFARLQLFAASFLALLAMLSVQALLWHAQTGNWFEWSYRNEGFHWHDTHTFHVLFGFRKGLFLYAPVLLVALIANVHLLRKDRIRGISSLVYWGLVSFVIGAWWIWYYAGTFGHRVFIDHYPVFAIAWGLMLNDLKRQWLSVGTRVFMVLACAYHLWWAHKFNSYQLDDRGMDREKYRWVLTHEGPQLHQALGAHDNVPPYSPNGLQLLLEERCTVEEVGAHWNPGRIAEMVGPEKSRTNVCVLDSSAEYGPSFILPLDSTIRRPMFIEVTLWRYEERPRDSFDALAVFTLEQPGLPAYYYNPGRLNPVPGGTAEHWRKLRYTVELPAPKPGSELRFYIWNKGRARFLVDDLHARLWTVAPY
ncbi:MAG: hypothetical protein IPJ76_07730 [Flavobacteriales bacterium]|nr:MAG: hypothetical protein IPJ76_07730 [Flavobacteriales bacterium]